MLINNRVIWEDNVTLVDVSKTLNDVFANNVTFAYTAAEDYLYIGSDLPFCHRYFDVRTANAVASVASVEIWDGNAWNAAVDVIDETAVSGASLGTAGIIRWTLGRTESWNKVETTEDIPALSTIKIYNLYWARISWSASLTGTTAINYVGHSFANDSQLGGYYPDLASSDIISAYQTGKTNWKEQHILAAEELISDLKRKEIITSANQVMNPEIFGTASIHKCAEIIMRGLGRDYQESKAQALKDYAVALNSIPFNVDKNEDGRLDDFERRHDIGLSRR